MVFPTAVVGIDKFRPCSRRGDLLSYVFPKSKYIKEDRRDGGGDELDDYWMGIPSGRELRMI